MFVHRSLLCSLGAHFCELIDDAEKTLSDGVFTIFVDADTATITEMARLLYGQSRQAELEELATIYHLMYEKGAYDAECMKICVQLMQEQLNHHEHDEGSPVRELQEVIHTIDKSKAHPGKDMIINELVYEKSAHDGRAKSWLSAYLNDEDPIDQDFLAELCLEFANKAAKEGDAEPE